MQKLSPQIKRRIENLDINYFDREFLEYRKRGFRQIKNQRIVMCYFVRHLLRNIFRNEPRPSLSQSLIFQIELAQYFEEHPICSIVGEGDFLNSTDIYVYDPRSE